MQPWPHTLSYSSTGRFELMSSDMQELILGDISWCGRLQWSDWGELMWANLMLACNVMFIIANIREQGTMSNAHAVFFTSASSREFANHRAGSQLKNVWTSDQSLEPGKGPVTSPACSCMASLWGTLLTPQSIANGSMAKTVFIYDPKKVMNIHWSISRGH